MTAYEDGYLAFNTNPEESIDCYKIGYDAFKPGKNGSEFYPFPMTGRQTTKYWNGWRQAEIDYLNFRFNLGSFKRKLDALCEEYGVNENGFYGCVRDNHADAVLHFSLEDIKDG